MDETLSKFFEMRQLARQEEQERQRVREDKERRRRRWVIANTTVLGEKLRAALKK